MTDLARDVAEAARYPAGQRKMMDALIAIVLVVVFLYTKGTLDEVTKLRQDVTTLQIEVTQLRTEIGVDGPPAIRDQAAPIPLLRGMAGWL